MGMKDKVLMEKTVPAAAKTLDEMANPTIVCADKVIPLTLLRNCKGIAFITIYKAGMFFVGGQVGGGCVVTKISDPSSPLGYRWSGPVGVQVGGLQGGFLFGGEKISSIILLNTDGAIRGFMGDGQIQFGGAMSLAVGPTGRDAAANIAVSNTKEIVPAYSYSIAKGAYIGATLDGVVLKVNKEDCQNFYGTSATPEDILTGKITPPQKCDTLYNTLDSLTSHAVTPELASPAATLKTGVNSVPPPPAAENNNRSELPSGWQELVTPDGKPYYFNKSTNATTWDRPAVQQAQIPARPEAPMRRSPEPAGLPPGWEELETENGKKYYCNRALNVTQWSHP
jgi:lipid-binding SYLF domain-containing protein